MSMKLFAKIGAVAALGLGLAFTTQAVASADTTTVNAPAISVTPSSGLSDGASVAVSGTGLTAGTTYHVGECAVVGPQSMACNSVADTDVVADASGAASTPLTVRKAFTGTAHDGSTHAIDCGTQTCVVAFYSDTFEGGQVALSFN